MPSNPSGSDQHINALLTAVSVGYVQTDEKFVSRKVFPVVNVNKQSGRYATYDRGDFLRDDARRRAPGTESAGGGYGVSSSVFTAETYAFHRDVADEDRAHADQPYDLDRDAAVFLAQKALLKEEVQWASTFFTTGVWTGSSTATDLVAGTDFIAWDDPASTPIENISDQQAEIESDTGVLANVVVLNRRGWAALKNHPDVIDRVKHTSGESVSTEIVARLMGVERILVAAGVRNTADTGATAVTNYIVGNHALLAYAPSSPGLYVPASGYTFLNSAQSTDGQAVSTFRMEWLKSDRHEIEWAFDQVAIAPLTGAFFSTIVT